MRKWLVYFLGLVLIHSFCEAQDTIVFQTGEKDAVTITSFGKKTINFILLDTAYSVNESRVNYIKYRDGIRYSYKDLYVKYDSASKIENAEMAKEDSADFRPIRISIGIGASSIESDILTNANIPGGYYGPYFLTQSPVFSGIIDYSFMRQVSIGIGAAYQWATDNPSEQPGYNAVDQLQVEKIFRYNYSVRALYHLLKHAGLDVYAGVRGGISIWKEQMVSNSNPPGVSPFETAVPSKSQASYQVLIGGMFPVYGCLGVHLELAFGTPYLFEGGITFLL